MLIKSTHKNEDINNETYSLKQKIKPRSNVMYLIRIYT